MLSQSEVFSTSNYALCRTHFPISCGGNSFFFPIMTPKNLGEDDLQFDGHLFFRVGKNHQLVKVLKCHSPSDFCSSTNPITSWEWYWNLSLYISIIYPVGFCHRFLFQVFLLEPSPQFCANYNDQLLPKQIRCKGSVPKIREKNQEELY